MKNKIIIFLILANILSGLFCLYFRNKLNVTVSATSNEITNMRKFHDEETEKIKAAYEIELRKNEQVIKDLEFKKSEIEKKYNNLYNAFIEESKKKVERRVKDSTLEELAIGIIKGIENYEKINY